MPRHDKTGETFGPYVLIKRLAIGGMGEIWLAERKGISGFSKRVVVKTILDAYSDDPELVEMFLQEGRIAAGLTHPNIAQTLDLGQVGDIYYIAIEHVHGRDLRELLVTNIEMGKHIPLNLVLRIGAEACEGLHHAHTWKEPGGRPVGIVHRDISPQNIMVTFDGGVKVVDFGIAKATHFVSKTKSGVLKGKYSYMSPEQIRGKHIDARADMFSLGVVMYETVTGRRLFKRESEVSTLDAVLKGNVPPPTRLDQSIPKPVEKIIMTALDTSPERRFQTARQMQLAIEDTMLAVGLTASSAHLSAYMHELFGEDEEEESSLRLDRRMDKLPGTSDDAPPVERTQPFTAGSVVEEIRRQPADPTRNLVMGTHPPYTEKKKSPMFWFGIVGFSVLLAISSWYLVTVMMNDENGGPVVMPVDPGTALQTDAGSDPRGPPDAGGGSTATNVDAGSPSRGADPVPPGKDERKVAVLVPDKGPRQPSDPGLRSDPKPRKSYLTVSTEPSANIFLDKRKLGQGSISKMRVPPGKHKLKLVVPGGGSKTIDLVIWRGSHITRSIKFGKGKLRVVVMPWADVWVDGKKIGQTPIKPISLIEGIHKVSMVNSGLGKKEDRKVRIHPGKESKIQLDWR